MKQILTSFKILSAIALLALAIGCANTQSKENSLVAAGFKRHRSQDCDAGAETQGPSAGQGDVGSEEWEDLYVFPDAAHNQAYDGGPKQYQAYRQLRLKQKLADEKLEAAEMNMDASEMDWGGWGGWGGWGSGWY